MEGGGRARGLIRGFVKFLSLVLVAGGVGAALGTALVLLSQDHQSGAPVADVPANSGVGMTDSTRTRSLPATAPDTRVAESLSDQYAPVGVLVLGSRLFVEPRSGSEGRRGRMTVRIRVQNLGVQRVPVPPATLRVGTVDSPVERDADPAGAAALEPGAFKRITLRFVLTGSATSRVVRDRRARILVAARSVPMRVRVQAPAR